jgi:hypothetical protein
VRGVHPKSGPHGAVNDDKRRAPASAGGAAMHVVLCDTHRPQDGHDDRHVGGEATGHDRIDGGLFRANRALAHRLHADDVLGRKTSSVEELAHPLFRRRHNRQAVGPPFLLIEFVHVQRISELIDG